MAHHISIIRHQLTDVVLYGEGRGGGAVIFRVLVGGSARRAIEASGGIAPEPELASISHLLRDYLDGRITDLASISIDPGAVSPFRSAVLNAARRIPYGAVCSYAELARSAGFPKAVRAAASVMRNNRLPLVIPCHRVIRSDGSAGAFCGDREGEDAALKKTLLRLEASVLKKRF
ncbi:MAG: MGMT family protein [Chitinispirillaceae bacterium]|nr:MGMT family protein [Chitinispirillaceae bacterium]